VVEPEQVRERALMIGDPTIRKAAALSADHSVYYCFGFFETDGTRIFNTAALAGEGRILGVHRKVHIAPREGDVFSPGEHFRVWELPFARVGISICYDNEIAESHLSLAVAGAELIVMPVAWADHWEREDYIERCSTDEEVIEERRRWMYMMFGSRCRDTGTYSVLANQCGPEGPGPSRFAGKSMIFAPTGRVLAEARAWEDDIICADLPARLLDDYRAMDAFALKGRRPQAYESLR
jgi:predicted amidohydrolase